MVDTNDTCRDVRHCKSTFSDKLITRKGILDLDHSRNTTKVDIEDAVTYIHQMVTSQGWVFVKEKETICYTSFDISPFTTDVRFLIFADKNLYAQRLGERNCQTT